MATTPAWRTRRSDGELRDVTDDRTPDGSDVATTDGDESPIRPLRRRREPKAKESPFLTLLCIVAFALLSAFYLVSAAQGKGTAVGLVLVPLFGAALAPWVMRLARAQTAFRLAPIVFLGLVLRSLAAYFRLENAADAIYYHQWGVRLASEFKAFNFAPDTQREIPGTGTVRWVSGLVSVFTGNSIFAEFLVFTVFAFIGCLFFYMAFVTALPNGDHRRYALLIFLWPTMVYWPASIGKEAIMTFGMGVASYGAARLFRRHRGGVIPLALGLWITFMVRPHIALAGFIAVGIAFLFTRRTGNAAAVTAGKAVGVFVLLLVGGILIGRTAEFLEVESLNSEGIDQALNQTTQQTSQGDAEFRPFKAENPALLPGAVVTVLFRPFPHEAHNTEAFLTSLEGFVLVALILGSFRRLAQLPRALIREPYVAYSLAGVLLLCFLFSYVANFGILARQRTQVLPFLFVLVSFVPNPRKLLADARTKRRRSTRATLLSSHAQPVASAP